MGGGINDGKTIDERGDLPQGAFRAHPDVVTQRVQDEIVLVHLRTNEIYTLNRTGARAWELLAEGRSRDEIQKVLVGEFEAAEADVSEELDSLLGDLFEKELIQPA